MPKEQSLHELAGDLILPVINLIEQGQSFVVDVTRPNVNCKIKLNIKKKHSTAHVVEYICKEKNTKGAELRSTWILSQMNFAGNTLI